MSMEFEQGWCIVQEGLTKLKNVVARKPDESHFTPQKYMSLYE